ncbi:hypothetical protein SDC9_112806 [bioreactor metagenome]|uniref:Uncharacterized protein n=1 Tax=bioreactor metagenome TaxID=1076179 RepID=A0A645BL28_9ZZZZ
MAHAVHHHHFFEVLVRFWIARHGQPGGQAGAGADEVQVLAGQQIVDQQRAGGLLADDDGVAHLDVLQLGGQRAVRHLDRQELEVFLIVGAGDRVGAQQVLAVHLQAYHGEMAVREPQGGVACGGEGEKTVGPVVHRQDTFFEKCAHVRWIADNGQEKKQRLPIKKHARKLRAWEACAYCLALGSGPCGLKSTLFSDK